MEKRKFLALCLISIFLVHLYGTVTTLTIHSAFASNDTYSVENVIYFNATVLGKSKTIKLVIPDSKEPINIGIKASEYNTSPFIAESLQQTHIMQDYNEYTNQRGEISFANSILDLTNAQKGVATIYNNYTMGENLSEFYENFNEVTYYFPVQEEQLLFNSPANYVAEFCDENGLTLETIVNSTYVETFDVDSLNLFKSQLVKTDFLITENLTSYDDYKTMESLDAQLSIFGGELVTKPFPWIALLIAVVVSLILTVGTITYCIIECERIKALREMALGQIWADSEVTIEAINGETNITISLVEAKATNEALVLEAFTNGSISFEECQSLLLLIGSDYSTLLSERSLNIVNITQDYFAHVEEQWESYNQGLAISTSWTDWLYILIIVLIVGFAIYMVYYFIVRKKGSQIQGTTNVFYR